MYVTRFIGTFSAFLLSALVSYLIDMTLFEVMAVFAFVLTVDSLIVRVLNNLYLKAVYAEMEKEYFKGKNDDSNVG